MVEQPVGHRPAGRAWLDVPYSEKDQAKALGARWDASARRWYAPSSGDSGLQRWSALPVIPDLLPGEDRTFGTGLFVDLVPARCWFSNVRSCVTRRDWQRLRRMLLARAGNRCEICGRGEDRAVQRWLEAHERWQFDDHTGVQSLRRLLLICSWCHRATHMGLAEVRGFGDEAFAHLCAVTGITDAEAEAHIDAAFALWRDRSARDWTLDLSILTTAGITLAPPPEGEQRAAIAEKRLREERSTDSHSDSAGGVGEELSTQSASDMLALEAASAAARAGLTEPAPVLPPAADPWPLCRWWWRRSRGW
jgi:hypothetical protein